MRFAGTDIQPCLSGALFLPEHAALLVADLHLEKGSSRAHRGELLPPYDTRASLMALAQAIEHWKPERVILLGDSFHDVAGFERMAQQDRSDLVDIATKAQFVWLSGNHDPELPRHLPGVPAHEMTLGDITLRHEPMAGQHLEIAGHLHPVSIIRQRGRRLRTKCFVVSASRIILPAFGAYTGGLNIRHEAFRPFLSGDAFNVIMVGRDALHTLPGRSIL